jgi:EAL domain-containing protein (putative c-di-GMP-specific phosphodiesterase class I)
VHACGASVITPQVHTEEQARWWREMGADVACGDQLGPAQPPEAITELLRSAPGATGGW